MIGDALDELRFKADIFRLYHEHRRDFYVFLDKLVKGVSVLAGSTIVAAVGATATGRATDTRSLIIIAAFSISILNVFGLVVGFVDQRLYHENMAKRYLKLLDDMDLPRLVRPDKSHIHKCFNVYDSIKIDEAPIFWAILAQCYNRVATSAGRPTEFLCNLPLWKVYLGHFSRCMNIHSK